MARSLRWTYRRGPRIDVRGFGQGDTKGRQELHFHDGLAAFVRFLLFVCAVTVAQRGRVHVHLLARHGSTDSGEKRRTGVSGQGAL